jgi:HD-like signal output (HDOD) protein
VSSIPNRTRLDAIRPRLEHSPARELKASSNPIAAFRSQLGEIAVMPQVVFKVMELSGSDGSSAQNLEDTISVDPGFSARVLKLANSAQFALPRKVSSVRDAVVLIGFRSVRQMAMQAGVFDLFVGKNDRESLRRRGWWRLSLDTAAAARHIARAAGADPDSAGTAGLLHLIGRTVLDRLDPKASELSLAAEQEGVPTESSLKFLFGIHHGEASLAAAEAWSFPESLSQALNWVEPAAEPEANRGRAVTALAHLAGLQLRPGGAKLPEPAAWTLEALSISRETAEDWIGGAVIAGAAAAAMGAGGKE